jgi:hypothetical protein
MFKLNFQIIDLSNSNRFDVACTRYFESVHNIPENGLGMLITHPNQYYSQSRKIISGEISRDVSSYSQTLTFDSSSQQSQTPILSENAEELF